MEKEEHRRQAAEPGKRPEDRQAENKNANNSQEANRSGNETSRQNAKGGGRSGA